MKDLDLLKRFSTDEIADELLRRLDDVETVPEDRMLRIDGELFRCDCGCNVFRAAVSDSSLYVCNSCSARWRGEK